jgi:hypothetical protein
MSDKLLNYIDRLPYELVDIIKTYIPINIIKYTRKINYNELPIKYRILKEIMNYYDYKKMGYEIDNSAYEQHLKILKIQKFQKLNIYNSTISIPSWFSDIKDNVNIIKQISNLEKLIDENKKNIDFSNEKYNTSRIHLKNFKIILNI